MFFVLSSSNLVLKTQKEINQFVKATVNGKIFFGNISEQDEEQILALFKPMVIQRKSPTKLFCWIDTVSSNFLEKAA
ncbi:hypothetical protein OQJ13_02660 [Legionella sp. PATHC035]|uniref:hypothetical protein n=1 Tax=Legionella sp. PATHC035 TaxID=2992040 RepID=UPI002244AC95|nr:hypothetical protein [Legionella sp. PATHC035]MCW8407869.1 hypothetical protein [Legionella sp. PATHC035]